MTLGTEVLAPRDLSDPKQSVEAMIVARLRSIESGQRRLMLAAFGIVAVFFGGLTAWSILAPIDSAVVAEGQIVVAGSRNLIQAEKGGVVSEILFHDGDRVEQGQVVLRLDSTRALAAYQQLLVRYYEASALRARLVAERDGSNAIPFPAELIAAKSNPGVAKAVQGQQTVFQARKDTIDNQAGILRQKVRESQDEIEGWRTRIAAEDDQLALLQREADSVASLVDRQLSSQSPLLALQRSIADIKGDQGLNRARIAGAQQAILESQLQIIDLKNRQMSEVTQQLREADASVADIDERLRAAKRDLDACELRAPKTGTVVNSSVHTVGGVVNPADTVMEIVPEGDKLLVEANIRPQDIEHVHVNLKASVRLVGFNSRTVPTVEGTVTYVSADSLTDKQGPLRHYVVRVAVDLSAKRETADLKLQPGMPAHVLVITGNRTLFGYLLAPIADSVKSAMHEM